ncbi:MAG TPA: asparagine synthase-related protein, partial [Segetibacter sp.]
VFEDKKFSEEKYQKIIIDKTGAKHSAVIITEEEFAQSLPDILQAMDQPSIDGINTYFICKYAHKFGLKAVLSGIGADELFGGYNSFYRTDKVALLNKLPSFVLGLSQNFSEHRKKKFSFLKRRDQLGNFLFNRGIYTPEEIVSILECSLDDIYKALNEVSFTKQNLVDGSRDIVSAYEQNIYMQSQLLKDTDYMGMWHGLEVRVPFLDKELMETVYSIAPAVKYDSSFKKHLLIRAFKDILPAEIYSRKKQGFTFPFKKWIIPVQTTAQRNITFIQKHKQLKAGQLQWAHYWAYMQTCNKRNLKYYDKPLKKILFLTLSAFSFTGGIEKFNRAFLKALSNLEAEGKLIADSFSAYDDKIDVRYFDESHYKGFKGNRIKFVLEVLKVAKNYDTIIIGHINISVAAWAIKKMFPQKKIILITHGIEVWDKLGGAKNFIVQAADKVFAVSQYTKDAIVKVQKILPEKISVFHNTIDPYFSYPTTFQKPLYLLDRYKIETNALVIFTLTRLSNTEKYKGYDKVTAVLPQLKKSFPNIKYILSGKGDEIENSRLIHLQKAGELIDTMQLTGFIKEEEVVDHFLLADVFIMPSTKEGFGIVFIEAMACGLPVIAGNQDGSVDALQNGALGQLVNPESGTEIFNALQNVFHDNNKDISLKRKKELQQKVKQVFGFE